MTLNYLTTLYKRYTFSRHNFIGASVSEPHTSDANRDFSLSVFLSVCLSRTSCRIYAHYSIFAYYEHVRALIEIFAYKILQLWIFRPLTALSCRSTQTRDLNSHPQLPMQRERRDFEDGENARGLAVLPRDQKKRRQGM